MRTKLLTLSAILFMAIIIMVLAIAAPSVTYAESTECYLANVTDEELINNEYAFKSNIALLKGSETFYIPVSYYFFNPTVCNDTYYYVEYAGQNFYITKELIDQQTPVNLEVVDGVSYSPDITLTLKPETTVKVKSVTVDDTYEIKFLGYSEDETQYFVMIEVEGTPKFDFIPKESVEEFNVPYQNDAALRREQLLIEKKNQDSKDSGYLEVNSSYALRIIIIVAIAIPLVSFTLLMFKKNKNVTENQQLSVEKPPQQEDQK